MFDLTLLKVCLLVKEHLGSKCVPVHKDTLDSSVNPVHQDTDTIHLVEEVMPNVFLVIAMDTLISVMLNQVCRRFRRREEIIS